MEQEETVVSTVRTPKDVYEELALLAKEERRSVNATMVIAFERYIRQMKARRPKDAQASGVARRDPALPPLPPAGP